MRVERLEFSREGGFTGIPLTVEFDIDSLAPEDATTLQELVGSADFFHLPSVIPGSRHSADNFKYTISVTAEGKRHTVKTAESTPESLDELIAFLTKLARKARARRPT